MRLKWYESLGWLVELILIGFAMVCLYTFFEERQWRAFGVSLVFFGVCCGGWLWVLLKYSR